MKVFLSHAHIESKTARWLANELRTGLALQGFDVDVFCTSEPENRFPDFAEVLQPGELAEARAKQYVNELREYLSRAMADASAYALLITELSVRRSGPWIRFEIHEATALARDRKIPFVPCLFKVGYEALEEIRSARPGKRWEEAEVAAPPAEQMRVDEWQAARVDKPEELRGVINALAHAFAAYRMV